MLFLVLIGFAVRAWQTGGQLTSGSRLQLLQEAAERYQKLGDRQALGELRTAQRQLIAEIKREGRNDWIQSGQLRHEEAMRRLKDRRALSHRQDLWVTLGAVNQAIQSLEGDVEAPELNADASGEGSDGTFAPELSPDTEQ